MDNRRTSATAGHGDQSAVVPWKSLENRTARAFALGGTLLVASVVVPVGLEAITDWYWAAGLVLVGFAVLSVAAGLLGLYPEGSRQSPWLARTGLLSATVAGMAALVLLLMVGTATTAAVVLGASLPKPMGVFGTLALSMAAGIATGFVSFGVARSRTEERSDTPGRLLVAGGAVLLVPVVGELARIGVGIGPPPWVLFPALGLVAVDALAVGYSLRTESDTPR